MLEKIFKLKENNTTARTEIIAGLTTFMTMAYIIALNPNLLTGFGKDTNTTTYHIEFRYGSDLDALGQYDAGPYAYWLASGISTDYDQTMIENCIELFCTENLSA